MAVPVVKWVGGKRGIADELMARMPSEYADYHEPFFGGGALMLALEPSLHGHATHISDLNADVICVYKAIRDDCHGMLDILDELIANYSKNEYYAVRATLHEGTNTERAAKFVFLNKTGYNGVVRYNSKGGYNVPWGHKETITTAMVYDRGNVEELSALLQNADIRCQSYEKSKPRSGDFMYLDPPYASTFTTYNAGGFGDNEQRKLAEWCQQLDKSNVKFMLSNSDVPFIHELYGNFNLDYVMAPRAVSRNGNGRKPVREVLVTNY